MTTQKINHISVYAQASNEAPPNSKYPNPYSITHVHRAFDLKSKKPQMVEIKNHSPNEESQMVEIEN